MNLSLIVKSITWGFLILVIFYFIIFLIENKSDPNLRVNKIQRSSYNVKNDQWFISNQKKIEKEYEYLKAFDDDTSGIIYFNPVGPSGPLGSTFDFVSKHNCNLIFSESQIQLQEFPQRPKGSITVNLFNTIHQRTIPNCVRSVKLSADTISLNQSRPMKPFCDIRGLINGNFIKLEKLGNFPPSSTGLQLCASGIEFNYCHFNHIVPLCHANHIKFFADTISNSEIFCYSRRVDFDKVIFSGENLLQIMDTVIVGELLGSGKIKIRPFGNNPVLIVLSSVSSLEHIDIPNYGINFQLNSNISYQDSVEIYKGLTNHYQDLEEDKMKYDVQLQRLLIHHNKEWFTGFIREKWNYFGYRRNLIFGNAWYLMLLFLSINFLVFPKLLHNGYVIEEFERSHKVIKYKYRNKPLLIEILSFFICIIYTFFIFWGLKLNFEKLKVAHVGFTILILTQYIIGIVCLAYIANIIIAK